MGYKLQVTSPAGPSTPFYTVQASAAGCKNFALDLLVHEGKIAVVLLAVGPVKPKRKWTQYKLPDGVVDWETVPAAWFGLTVKKLLEVHNVPQQRTA